MANSEYKDEGYLEAGKKWYYWLRSPYAYYGDNVRYVYSGGFVYFNSYAYNNYAGVRPAFYLNLQSAIFKSGYGTSSAPYTVEGSKTLALVTADNDITVTLNGSQLSFDVPPQIINDRTMVPLRAIFEALGASGDWNQDTQTVTSKKDGTTISLTINSLTMYVNGSAFTLDSPACVVDNRTLVPVRAISEAYNTSVDWDNNTRTVKITSK